MLPGDGAVAGTAPLARGRMFYFFGNAVQPASQLSVPTAPTKRAEVSKNPSVGGTAALSGLRAGEPARGAKSGVFKSKAPVSWGSTTWFLCAAARKCSGSLKMLPSAIKDVSAWMVVPEASFTGLGA